MKVGTKSILFGVHNFVWHPITVILAWWRLYGRPSWQEVVCIIIHDWGYWGCPNMDGREGEQHPARAALLAWRLFLDMRYHNLVLYHSRHYSRLYQREPSKLCWADKLSILYDPWWFYLPRAWLSGELKEYRRIAADAGFLPLSASHREWFNWIRARFEKIANERRGDVVPYMNPSCRGQG